MVRRSGRVGVIRGVLAGLILGGLLAGCGGSPAATPSTIVQSFTAAWSHRDWGAMRPLVDDPPADFAQLNEQALRELGASSVSIVATPPVRRGDVATAHLSERYRLAGVGELTLGSTVRLRRGAGGWLVEWSPATIDSALSSGSAFHVTVTWAPRAAILGAGGTPLTVQAPLVTVGIEGKAITHARALGEALVDAGATSAEVSAALSAADVEPTYFEPVFTVSYARYLELKPAIYPLPGTFFRLTTARAAITPGLAAHLVGSVGPITAQELGELGAPYAAGDVVGQSGLEQAYQRRLAGAPGVAVDVVSAAGTTRTLVTIAPKPGTPVRTSIDPADQRAAEAALAGERKSAAFVAVDAATGQLLAVVSDPPSDQFDQALAGTFPAGSTFKIITSTALIDDGLSPVSAATCPTTIAVDGEVFHNAEGDQPVSDIAQAFTESCNTAFIGLAADHLGLTSLAAAAALYDLGRTPQMGVSAFGGAVPKASDEADLAATAIGQGQVLVSPLDMAMVAAAIDTGAVRAPRLVAGAPDDDVPPRALAPTVVADLRQMTADVVESGTAANEGLPPDAHAKTGTAQVGTGKALATDAWLIGYDGDIAFACLVVGGGNGGPTCGPLVATFFNDLGAG